jgi:hypothetical protein
MKSVMKITTEKITTENVSSKLLFPWEVLSEAALVMIIISIGWFLIGYYTQYEFLETGYHDWIYHAFRVRDIAQYGIASWDHVWSNGINHWRAFQYVEHVLIFLLTKLTGLSITRAMIWLSVIVFISLRVLIYGSLRYLGVSRLFSFFAVIISYASSQQWTALNDFSIYISFIVLPFYVLLWIAALKDMRYVYVLSAVTGASWSIHPVVGYSTAGMLFFLILANNLKKDFWKFTLVLGIFFVSSLPFVLPYLTPGYIITNPNSSTSQFLQQLLLPQYMGLSLVYFTFLALSWVILIINSNESPRWAKILLVYCTCYLCFIYFGLLGYYPSFIYKLQFSRAIPFIALLLSFCFAVFLQTALPRVQSRMIYTVFLVLSIVIVSQSIEIASRYSAQPTSSIQDPVATYFADKDIPRGSIYVKDVSSSSYLGKTGLRFVTSYNRFPNPYPIRFNGLMKTDISYTGVTDRQIKMINDYSTVLGVEYIFIPKLSPLVNGLTTSRESQFEKIGEVNAPSDIYAVLHNRQPIAYAYAFEKGDAEKMLRFSELQKPTLQAASYVPWDEEISRTASLIRAGELHPLPLSFVWPNKLVVDSSSLSSFQNPNVLITQSYDKNWSVSNMNASSIEPTNLRFMHVTLSNGAPSVEIDLQNNWPWWHWPVQSLGIVMIILTTISVLITGRARRNLSVSSR